MTKYQQLKARMSRLTEVERQLTAKAAIQAELDARQGSDGAGHEPFATNRAHLAIDEAFQSTTGE
jgi:hypothetical protein